MLSSIITLIFFKNGKHAIKNMTNKHINTSCKLVFILTCFLFLLQAQQVFSATYYIDYSAANDSSNGTSKSKPWKRSPGMKGFAGSYSHSAGDIFIFKGGVTWPAAVLPLTIGYSGKAGNIDTYTVDQTWYTGGSYSRPIFDGGGVTGGQTASGKSYFKVNGLQIQNVNSTTCGAFDGSYQEYSNLYLSPSAIQAFGYDASSNQSHIYFHDNYITNSGRFVIYGATGYILDDVRVYNNTINGAYLSPSFHLDGLMIGNPMTLECGSGSVATVTNILFYNNKFYGDWHAGATAMYFSNGCTNYTTIYNNIFAIEDSTGGVNLSPAFVFFGQHDGNISIYNNTFSSDSYPGKGAGASEAILLGDSTYGNVIVEGNIFSGFGIDFIGGTSGTLVVDYNLHNISLAHGYGWLVATGGVQYTSLSSARAAGYETHGLTGNPKFVAVPNGTVGSGNWQFQSSSPAINKGVDLSASFTTDIVGNARSGSWDIGAYQRKK
jgi:hypothetical protein